MRLRRRKYAVLSVLITSVLLGLVIFRKVYAYIQTRHLVEKLGPGVCIIIRFREFVAC